MKKFFSRLVRDIVNCFLIGAGVYGAYHGVRAMRMFANLDLQQDVAESLAAKKKEEIEDEDFFEED